MLPVVVSWSGEGRRPVGVTEPEVFPVWVMVTGKTMRV